MNSICFVLLDIRRHFKTKDQHKKKTCIMVKFAKTFFVPPAKQSLRMFKGDITESF